MFIYVLCFSENRKVTKKKKKKERERHEAMLFLYGSRYAGQILVIDKMGAN